MAFTLRASAVGSIVSNNNPATVQVSGVQAGDLVVCFTKNEGAESGGSVSDGTSTLTALPGQAHASVDLWTRLHYLLASVASGTVTYTFTSSGASWKQVGVLVFAHDGDVSFDQHVSATGTTSNGNVPSPASGNLTTTGSRLAIGACGEWNQLGAAGHSNQQIAGVAADGVQEVATGYMALWWDLDKSAGTFNASESLNNNPVPWNCHLATFSEAAGGGTTPTRGRLSFSEVEFPFLGTRGRLSFTELESPFVPSRGRISFAETEIPLAPTRGRFGFAETEIPFSGTRGRVSFTELESPFVSSRGRISFVEVELPITPTRGRVSWAEGQVPSLTIDPTRGRISWLELEVPSLATRGRIGFAELEAPLAKTRGRFSWAELETPVGATTGRIAQAELEVPPIGTRGRVSFVEFEINENVIEVSSFVWGDLQNPKRVNPRKSI